MSHSSLALPFDHPYTINAPHLFLFRIRCSSCCLRFIPSPSSLLYFSLSSNNLLSSSSNFLKRNNTSLHNSNKFWMASNLSLFISTSFWASHHPPSFLLLLCDLSLIYVARLWLMHWRYFLYAFCLNYI